MSSSGPRFSIVIPTRERATTLRSTLRTCMAQRFDDYEVVVCDNCSSPPTRAVVESFESPKIRYVRSDKPLAMSDNWELALSHTRGEFVTVVGDDDGLLFHALAEADRVISRLGVKALRWEWIYYNWPETSPLSTANRLSIPMPVEDRTLCSRAVIGSVAGGHEHLRLLPMIYNSVIHHELIETLRRKTGRVFKGITPDVYSGFAFAYLTKRYGSVGIPMGINAASPKSTGRAMFFGWRDSPVFAEYQELNCGAGLQWHPRIPHIPQSLPAVIAESFERANDCLFTNGGGLSIDRRRLVDVIIANLRQLRIYSDQEWDKALAAIDASLSDDEPARQWLRGKYSNGESARNLEAADIPSDDKRFAVLDGAALGVTDIHGVATLMDNLFSFCGPRWRLKSQMHLAILRQKGLAEFLRSLEILMPIRRIRVAFRDEGFRGGIRALSQEARDRVTRKELGGTCPNNVS